MLRRQYTSFDYWLLLATIALTVFGLVMIGSATRINVLGESRQFNQQLTFLVLGLVLLLTAAFIDYHFIAKFFVPIYLLCIGLLVGTLLYGWYFTPRPDVWRWIFIGTPTNNIGGMQPSEFTKVFMIIFLATVIDKFGAVINNFRMLVFLGISIIVPVGLIFVQPSLSASMVVLMISLAVLFAGNVGGKHVFYELIVLTPIAMFAAYDLGREQPLIADRIFQEYQLGRIETILNPDIVDTDARFQIERSIAAIGSGQLTGKGLYQGTIVQTARLPHAETDFIISVIGEEFGFVGLMGVLLAMLFVVARCLYTAATAPDMLGRLIASGVGMMLAFQSFINVGVVTELLPNTGVPFPFVSYGGSSLVTSLIAIGLVINVQMSKSKSIFEE